MKFGFDLDLNPKYDVDNQQQKDFYDNSNIDKLVKLADLYYKNGIIFSVGDIINVENNDGNDFYVLRITERELSQKGIQYYCRKQRCKRF